MKILVLMPLDETGEDYSMALWKYLGEEFQDIVFPMPEYANFLDITKGKKKGRLIAIIAALMDAKQKIEQEKDIIVLGNADPHIDFDFVFALKDKNGIIKDHSLELLKSKKSELGDYEEIVYNTFDSEKDTSLFISCEDLLGGAELIKDYYYIKKEEKEKLEELKRKYGFENGVSTDLIQ